MNSKKIKYKIFEISNIINKIENEELLNYMFL